jgi:phage terminase small subunit
VARKPPANLVVIPKSPEPDYPEPPRHLGEHGMALWKRVVETYAFDDPGSTETLFQACAAVDRAERCREQIDRDGEMIKAKTGMRSNPLLRDELANRAFAVRALARLGMDLEPVRAPGRPGGPAYT